MNIFKTQYLYTRHSWNTRHHFLCPAWSLTGNSPFVSCEKERSGARDEGIYQWVRVRILFVVNSRLLVLARMKTPKKSHNILENAFFDTAVMSGVRIFAVNAAFEKPRSAQFVLHRTKRKCLIIPRFLPEKQLWGNFVKSLHCKSWELNPPAVPKLDSFTLVREYGLRKFSRSHVTKSGVLCQKKKKITSMKRHTSLCNQLWQSWLSSQSKKKVKE